MTNDPYPQGLPLLSPEARFPGGQAPQRGGRSDPIQGNELSRKAQSILRTCPLRAASMTSLSSPVACSSSVGTPPKRKGNNYDVG